MSFNYKRINKEILVKWHNAKDFLQIPDEAYTSNVVRYFDFNYYSFVSYANEYRQKRYGVNKGSKSECVLCDALKKAETNPILDICSDLINSFLVTPNPFPLLEGASIAISKIKKPMFDTCLYEGLENDLAEIFEFADKTGFRVYHNAFGMGATIPHHEHYHLLNFSPFFEKNNHLHGFESINDFDIVNVDVKLMKDFPFAHLIFPQENPSKITHFIRNLNKKYGLNYANKTVPHSLIQGYSGILVVPSKTFVERGRGAGDIAGTWYCPNNEILNSLSLDKIVLELEQILFKKNEINLKNLL